MIRLTKEEVLHIAKLAKLDLQDKEIDKFAGQLSKVIEFVGSLKQVDVKGLEPTAQVTGLTDIYREDKVSGTQPLSQDEVLSGTEETYNGFFKVGAILTERSDK